MTTKYKVPLVIMKWCKGCGICVALRPENVLVLGPGDKAAASCVKPGVPIRPSLLSTMKKTRIVPHPHKEL